MMICVSEWEIYQLTLEIISLPYLSSKQLLRSSSLFETFPSGTHALFFLSLCPPIIEYRAARVIYPIYYRKASTLFSKNQKGEVSGQYVFEKEILWIMAFERMSHTVRKQIDNNANITLRSKTLLSFSWNKNYIIAYFAMTSFLLFGLLERLGRY